MMAYTCMMGGGCLQHSLQLPLSHQLTVTKSLASPLPSLVYQDTWSTSYGINNSVFPVYMIVLITQVFSCESSEEMTLHVESCLSKSSSALPSTAVAENDGVVSTELESNHSSSGESDEDYETYTWCGQTRIRATTMLGMPPCLMA